ncbi:MAG: phage major capsid protein [Chloroflexi bacterium]|nr:phage major capsid protein [Chloroflexota bacterium]
MDVRELRAKQSALTDEMQVLLDLTEKEDRDLTDDEKEKFDKLKGEHDSLEQRIERMEGLEERQSKLNKSIATPPDQGQPGDGASSGDSDFRSFGEFMQCVARAGLPEPRRHVDPRLEIEKRAATGQGEAVGSEGGFLVNPQYSAELFKAAYETGQVARRCRHVPISSNRLIMKAIDETSRATGSRRGSLQLYWLDEGGTKTASEIKWREMEWKLKKLIGLWYATDELLDDATALGAMGTMFFGEEFSWMLDDACIWGTGAGQPLGVMNSPCLVTVPKETGQATATLVYQNIMKMRARMPASSRPRAAWFYNQGIETQLHQMSMPVGTGGVPVYMPAGGLSDEPYDRLYGSPCIPIEQAQTLGTLGDIIYADMSQYMLVDRGGMKSDMSIHVRFNNDETTFRFVMRVDGMALWNSAITPTHGTNTLSPMITLAARP